MRPKEFVSALCSVDLDDTFNPYTDQCELHDRAEAPKLRARMLQEMLEHACGVEIDALWIGRDLGHRGGRRTGLALTDDVHLSAHAARWNVSSQRPTKGGVVAERTAAVIWSVLSQIDVSVFLWNVFPFHPHEADDPFSNRSHTRAEGRVGQDILNELVAMLRPRRLLAIGNDAARAAERMSGEREVVSVRHPSYGGQTRFLRQTADLFDLREPQGSLL